MNLFDYWLHYGYGEDPPSDICPHILKAISLLSKEDRLHIKDIEKNIFSNEVTVYVFFKRSYRPRTFSRSRHELFTFMKEMRNFAKNLLKTGYMAYYTADINYTHCFICKKASYKEVLPYLTLFVFLPIIIVLWPAVSAYDYIIRRLDKGNQ